LAALLGAAAVFAVIRFPFGAMTVTAAPPATGIDPAHEQEKGAAQPVALTVPEAPKAAAMGSDPSLEVPRTADPPAPSASAPPKTPRTRSAPRSAAPAHPAPASPSSANVGKDCTTVDSAGILHVKRECL
jgi:hypothetical protein